MKKINFLTFNKMKMDNIGTSLNCIEMPIAYILSKYKTENFYYYILMSYIDRMWHGGYKETTLAKDNNTILYELGLQMEAIPLIDRESLLAKIKKSIDVGNPLLLLFDYYEMFYEETHYKRNHIPHGVVLSGYDDERQVFIIQESAHMRFTALYPLQLTYDMVFDILNKSKEFFDNCRYFESLIYSFTPYEKRNQGYSSIEYLKNELNKIRNNENSLVIEIRDFNSDCINTPQGMSGFKRKFSTSHKVFFDFFERILKIEDIEVNDRYKKIKEEYLCFYELLTSKTIRKYLKKENVEIENVLECIKKIKDIDIELYKVLLDILQNTRSYKNYALSGKVTASSESTYEKQLFCCNRLIDGIRDNNVLENMWANAEWDENPWVEIELPQKTRIQKVLMYHANSYPVCSYVIEASNSKIEWICLKTIENNNEDITIDYIDGNEYLYYRFRFTKPSSIDNAARLFEIELLGD